MKPQIILDEQPTDKCICGNYTFRPTMIFKRVSKFISLEPDDQFFPVSVFVCTECKQIREEYKIFIKDIISENKN